MRGAIKKVNLGKWSRRLKVWAAGLALAGLGACYIPGLSSLPEGDKTPGPGDPTGIEDTYYGKFMIYMVGNNKLSKLGGGSIYYMVGDETYFPSNDPNQSGDYNMFHYGHEAELTFNYKDTIKDFRPASSRPEAVVLNNQLTLFYTNARFAWTNPVQEIDCVGSSFCDPGNEETSESCNYPAVGDDIGSAYPIDLNAMYVAMFNSAADVDVFEVTISNPGTLAVFRVRYDQFNYNRSDVSSRRKIQISLRDASNNPLPGASSTIYGVDFWRWTDPDLTYYFPTAGDYYLVVEDMNHAECENRKKDSYWLMVESPNSDINGNLIMKGEIQPARSGNPKLNGGSVFEPDDPTTPIEDNWPDCDGVPGSGDEGDAGIFERCDSLSEFGAKDGAMQYQELDNKANLDDGEWFKGRPTNVPAIFGSEASVVKAPDRESLLMFVNYGSRIYMLESRDGLLGVNWDLTNLLQNRPAVVAREERGEGDPDAPVVSSGPYGFCDTWPSSADRFARPEIQAHALAGGTASGIINLPSAYPGTYAVSYGDNQYLDSAALVDVQLGHTITSGPDGIINTLFIPRYFAYNTDLIQVMFGIQPAEPIVEPAPGERFHGPGNPDNPPIYSDSSGAYVYPLAGDTWGGSDERAYLLGDDDEWNAAVFTGATDAILPAVYLRKQNCNFFELGKFFDRCAIGVPLVRDGSSLIQPIAVESGSNGRLDTVEKVLRDRGDDVLCHEGNTVAICPGRDGRFDWKDIYIPLQGDDRLDIVVDEAVGPNARVVGISSGPDGLLQTIRQPLGSPTYDILYLEGAESYRGGDTFCHDLNGNPAICPGLGETIYDYYSRTSRSGSSRKLFSIWTMYVTGLGPVYSPYLLQWPAKTDLYGVYDDEFCIVNGGIAICPGQNGHFEGYPLLQRLTVAEDEDLIELHEKAGKYLGKECYSMAGQTYKDKFTGEDKVRWVVYHDIGVRHDDVIKWDARRGWYITTGPNGINQTCIYGDDVKRIGFNKGVPNQPIIVDTGGDGLETYALVDEKIEWSRDVYKITTGADGVANSFAMGDDRLDLFFGTGKPDWPCVVAGPDGKADTAAKGNDSQLYDVGEVTGFDAYGVWSPEAVAVGNEIRLYYSGLGWLQLPEQFRESSGALASVGECRRPGLDLEWGRFVVNRSLDTTNYKIYKFLGNLTEEEMKKALDNGEGVALAPRIGLAVSDIGRLRRDPTDWTYYSKPVMDVGGKCSGTINPPITLPGLEKIAKQPDIHLYGLVSPEVIKVPSPDDEHDLFLMFYTGFSETDIDLLGDPKSEQWSKRLANIGFARSLDGVKWDSVRQFDPILAVPWFDLNSLLGMSSTQYAYPSVISAGKDDFGEPVYAMFFNQYENFAFDNNCDFRAFGNYDLTTTDHIGYAIRKGKTSLACSLAPDLAGGSSTRSFHSILQVAFLVIPFLLFIAIKLSRRERN